jgi:tetratricopeptide (TPR) repeat protein
LHPNARQTIDLIASFRIPATFAALVNLLVARPDAPFADDAALDSALADLEARGLMGWDRLANRYDLHPIVRGVVWGRLDEAARRGLYSRLNAHFGALPAISAEDVRSLADLTAPIELYNTLIGLDQYDDAFALFAERLNGPLLRQLAANRVRAELLEALFPAGGEISVLQRPAAIAKATNALATAYHLSGDLARAVALYGRAVSIAEAENNLGNAIIGLLNLSDALRQSGSLYMALASANRALVLATTTGNALGLIGAMQNNGLALLAIGQTANGQQALQQALALAQSQADIQRQGVIYAQLATLFLQAEPPNLALAEECANKAAQCAEHSKFESDLVRAIRLGGAVALSKGDLAEAERLLSLALTRARASNLVEQEILALSDLTLLCSGQGQYKLARRHFSDLWELAERGPYRLAHAQAYLNLCGLEQAEQADEGWRSRQLQAATAAYYLAWCDAPPYAGSAWLASAKQIIAAAGGVVPNDLPPFNGANFPPMVDLGSM